MNDYQKYARNTLEKLYSHDRKSILSLFEKVLTDRLKPYTDKDEYWNEVEEIIKDLRKVDHDLWSHDYDGETKQIWGWDYMNMKTAGFLQITFDFNNEVQMYWRDNS